MTTKTLAIIVATYAQGEAFLPGLVYGLVSQTCKDFRAYIIHDGPSVDSTGEFMEDIVRRYPDNFVYIETERRIDCWGHNCRQVGLDLCQEEYITFTNGDNIYCKDYAAKICTCVASNPEVSVITNGIAHNYFDYYYFPGESFALCQTDFLNFVVRSDMAKQVPFRIQEFAADGHYIEDFKRKFPSLAKVHIPGILGTHQ